LTALAFVADLENIIEVLQAGGFDAFRQQLQNAEVGLNEARQWRDRQLSDSRLRLKAVAARWHNEHHPDQISIADCPLCGKTLDDLPGLASELNQLRNAADAAEQTFAQACIILENNIRDSWPLAKSFDPEYWKTVQPKQKILALIRDRFVTADRYSQTLIGISKRVNGYLLSAERNIPEFQEPGGLFDGEERLEIVIAAGKRLFQITEWWACNGMQIKSKWRLLNEGDDDEKNNQTCLQVCLKSCGDALALASPFQEAAADLENAFMAAKKWRTIEAEQKIRDDIAEALAPLKDLRLYIQHQTQSAINFLSSQIGDLLKRIYLIDNFRYENTSLAKRTVTVHGSFNGRYKVDATLVANTSWLRAVLWAFIFALRTETLSRLQFNPLPLLVLDDPQTTFDPQHRRKWAQLISEFQNLPQSDFRHGQFLITTHEAAFTRNLKVEGYSGALGTICGVRASAGLPAVILDGRRLDQLWISADEKKTPQTAREFISEIRLEIESRLRLILRGEGAEVATFILSELRDRLDSLHTKRVPPFDRPIFKNLLGLISASVKEMQLINWPHHFQDDDIGYSQAVDVEKFWRKKLAPTITNAFDVQRDYGAMHGDRLFSLAPRESITLPPGHEEVLRAADFFIRGYAAAMTNGRVSDGRLNVADYDLAGQISIKLLSHAVYVLTESTVEPVATTGDGLIVSHTATVNPKSLVVVGVEDVLRARRYDISETNPELAILTAQAINPYEIKSPIVVTRASINPKKVIGVLYGLGQPSGLVSKHEIEEIPHQRTVGSVLRDAYGLYKIEGRSAEPYVLDGQYLIVKRRSADRAALIQFDGMMTLAIDENGGHYFKRLRLVDQDTVILESLDLSGRESSIILGTKSGNRSALIEVIPVIGVLFDLPS
jgi:hypothetical protein